MPRQPRYTILGQPQHVIQRGNNRMPMFLARDNYAAFHEYLVEATKRFDCLVHAYVFMTNRW
jgi:putative transposase